MLNVETVFTGSFDGATIMYNVSAQETPNKKKWPALRIWGWLDQRATSQSLFTNFGVNFYKKKLKWEKISITLFLLSAPETIQNFIYLKLLSFKQSNNPTVLSRYKLKLQVSYIFTVIFQNLYIFENHKQTKCLGLVTSPTFKIFLSFPNFRALQEFRG